MEDDYTSAENSPTIYYDSDMTYKSSLSYQSYVNALCTRIPSLMTLSQFLSEPKTPSSGRICAIDFLVGLDQPEIRTDIKSNELKRFIRDEPKRETFRGEVEALEGRILLIEDLSRDIVELLGSELAIDPLFFALHLHTVRRTGSRHQTPDEATLPSRLSSRDFINVSYHRALVSDTATPHKSRFLRTCKVGRKLVFLRSTRIALAQHALILVDPPIDDHYITDDADKRPVTLDLRPFLGTYEDFVDPTSSNSYYDGERPASRSMQGMFDDIQHYWAHERPKSFDTSNPSIHALAYYMLSIVAAEWVKYVAVMQSCLKQYEYNHDQLPALSLDKFDKDLRELQSWRRRTMISQGKIKAVLRFLSSGHGCSAADIKLLSEDFEYLDGNIENVGRRLENMLPVVMSFVQITDARRSFAETANITRLTVLALIFVPLTFVSSLFSMNNSLDTLRQTIWMYFAIAVPLTTVVAVIAKPPLALRKWVGTIWIRSILKRKGNTRMSLKRMWRSETSGRELERLQASRNLEA